MALVHLEPTESIVWMNGCANIEIIGSSSKGVIDGYHRTEDLIGLIRRARRPVTHEHDLATGGRGRRGHAGLG